MGNGFEGWLKQHAEKHGMTVTRKPNRPEIDAAEYTLARGNQTADITISGMALLELQGNPLEDHVAEAFVREAERRFAT